MSSDHIFELVCVHISIDFQLIHFPPLLLGVEIDICFFNKKESESIYPVPFMIRSV